MMNKENAIALIKDKVFSITYTWNSDKNDIYNKVQLLKELVDLIADYYFIGEGKEYCKEANKFNIFVTNKSNYLLDIGLLNQSNKGRRIVILEETLRKEYEIAQILNEVIAKLFLVVKEGVKVPNKYYILSKIEVDSDIKKQMESIFKVFDKSGNVKTRSSNF